MGSRSVFKRPFEQGLDAENGLELPNKIQKEQRKPISKIKVRNCSNCRLGLVDIANCREYGHALCITPLFHDSTNLGDPLDESHRNVADRRQHVCRF